MLRGAKLWGILWAREGFCSHAHPHLSTQDMLLLYTMFVFSEMCVIVKWKCPVQNCWGFHILLFLYRYSFEVPTWGIEICCCVSNGAHKLFLHVRACIHCKLNVLNMKVPALCLSLQKEQLLRLSLAFMLLDNMFLDKYTRGCIDLLLMEIQYPWVYWYPTYDRRLFRSGVKPCARMTSWQTVIICLQKAKWSTCWVQH